MPETSASKLYSAVARHRSIIVTGSLCLALTSACSMNPGSGENEVPPSTTASPIMELNYPPPPERGAYLQQKAENIRVIAGVNENVQRAIRSATRVVGIDETYLLVVAARESSFDPRKRAYRTSAIGLYQFTADTWLRVIHTFGAKYGLEFYARQIVIDQEGRVSMLDGALRKKLLALRRDPQLSALMAAELARDNEVRLARILRRPVTPAELYMAHLLGVAHAACIIKAAQSSPQTPGVRLVPGAARANPGVFKPRGRIASARAIVRNIRMHYDREKVRFSVVSLQEG